MSFENRKTICQMITLSPETVRVLGLKLLHLPLRVHSSHQVEMTYSALLILEHHPPSFSDKYD